MSDKGKFDESAKLHVRASVSIAPISDADERLIDLLATFAFDLAQTVGCSRQTSSNANIQAMESTSGALEANLLSTGQLEFDMTLGDAEANVRCEVHAATQSDAGTEAWFRLDEPEPTRDTAGTKTMSRKRSELLAEAGGQRRSEGALGGLGLLQAKSSTRKRFGGSGPGGGGDDGGGSSTPLPAVIPLRKKR